MFPILKFLKQWAESSRRHVRQSKRTRTCRPSLECLEDRYVPSTFTVTNNHDSGAGSLRQAIISSNASTGGANTIDFDLPTGIYGENIYNDIEPETPLPTITHAVVFDGTTESGYAGSPIAVIDGTDASGPYNTYNQPSTLNGLNIDVSGCAVRGLDFIGWGNDGINIVAGNNEFIQSCYFGIAGPLYTSIGSVPGNTIGVHVGAGSTSDVIGGALAADRNLFGNNGTAIELQGAGANVFNNDIGTTRGDNIKEHDTITDLTYPNGTGILVTAGSDNLISDNVISGNTGNAITVTGAASTGNLILNNSIGLDTEGLYPIANNGPGIELKSGANNTQVSGNTIVASNGAAVEVTGTGTNDNTIDGNDIGVMASGSQVNLGNTGDGVLISAGAHDDTVGSAASPNVISQNGGYGVDITGTGTDDNMVANNFIGTNPAGTSATSTDYLGTFSLGNHSGGVLIADEASDNIIGSGGAVVVSGERGVGVSSGGGNVISGNLGYGVKMTGSGTNDNQVIGNFIGTNAAGAAAIGNHEGGVLITDDASTNTVGGVGLAAENVISGNTGNGVSITSGANHIVIEGNDIGLNLDQTAALGNTGDGVYITTSTNFIGVVGRGGDLETAAGNVISGNRGDGVLITGTKAQYNSLVHNEIGTDANGTLALPNRYGVYIRDGAYLTTIGGPAPADRNIISGNTRDGIAVTGSTTNDTTIEGNLIGLNGAGTAALANGRQGVILIDGAYGNTLTGNFISGNHDNGVDIDDSTYDTLEANLIGVNQAGTAAVPNGESGLYVTGSRTNQIGGTATGDANVFSGNAGNGVTVTGSSNMSIFGDFIGTNLGGTIAIANGGDGVAIEGGSTSINVGLAGNGNVISGNTIDGVRITGTQTGFNSLVGNYIGTVEGGEFALANGGDGIAIADHASANTVGGTMAVDRNFISGNAGNGVSISGAGTTVNQILDNTIGTDPLIQTAIPNGLDGAVITNGAANNGVNGNLLSGNGHAGLDFNGSGTGNTADYNWIGPASSGSAALPNGTEGVIFQNGASNNNLVSNLISGNPIGVVITGSGTNGNTLNDTWIGVNSTGTQALPNTGNGVVIEAGANNNVISGGIISGNTLNGVLITGAGTSGDKLQSNYIGTAVDHVTPIPNAVGVLIAAGASGNTVGGNLNGNIIADNTGDGIRVTGNASAGNTFSQNALFGNGGLAIDLVPPSPSAGPNVGPNHLQAAPVLNVGLTPGAIVGSLSSSASTNFTIEFFASAGPGQAQNYLGSEPASTNALGNATFNYTFTPTAANPYLTATATNLSTHDTSEVSTTLESGLSASGLALNSTVGIPFNGIVATFTPGYAGEPLSNFNVTINWGDGQTSAGTVVQGVNNSYDVVGTHTFSSPGTLLSVEVSIQDVLGNTTITANSTMTVAAD